MHEVANSKPTPRRRADLAVVGVLFVAAVLLFANLGDRLAWEDEGEMGSLARNILKYGIPRGWDGRNWTVQEGGAEFVHGDIYVLHPWLPLYMIAGMNRVFGDGLLVARLPFALLGVVGVWLTFGLFLTMGRSRRFALTAAAALMLMPPYLLHCRSVKYYAAVVVLALWTWTVYWRLLSAWVDDAAPRSWRGRARQAAALALPVVAMFYCNIGLPVCLCLGLILHYLLAAWLFPAVRRAWSVCVLSAVLFVAAAAPWLAFCRVFDVAEGIFKGTTMDVMLLGFIARLNGQVLPLALALLLFVPLRETGADGWRASLSRLVLWSVAVMMVLVAPQMRQSIHPAATVLLATAVTALAALTVSRLAASVSARRLLLQQSLFLSMFAGLVLGLTPAGMPPNIGYLVWLLPLVAGGVAGITQVVWRRSPTAAAALFALMMFTNWGQVGPLRALASIGANPYPALSTEWRSPLLGYLYELTHHYHGPVSAVVGYLRDHARREDVVFTAYGAMPLMYHTRLRLVRQIPFPETPDWVLMRGGLTNRYKHVLLGPRRFQAMQNEQYVAAYLAQHDYERIEMDAPNITLDMSPSLEVHKFRSVTEGPPLYLYHLRSKSSPASTSAARPPASVR